MRFNVIDRSLALGAQAFSALIPLLIVVQAWQSDTIAGGVIRRFELRDDAALAVREAFAVTSGETTTTSLSVVVLVVSVLAFTRRLQRLYEETWDLPARGLRGTGWGLAWIAFFGVYASLGVGFGALIGGFLVGLVTPYLLLGRRLPWRRLLQQAAFTGLGATLLGVWSAIYMPRAFESAADAYGAIGVAFALLTWLWGLGIVLVVAAVYGSPQVRFTRSG